MNRLDQLNSLLRSVEASLVATGLGPGVAEVIVSNDAETPLPSSVLRFARGVRGPSRGPAANRNFGASVSTGDVLLFVDDDVVVDVDWVGNYVAAIIQDKEKKVGVFEGRTLASNPKDRLDQISPINEEGGYFWTCNLAVRREVFVGLGRFEEQFPFADLEDVEFRHRLVKAGITWQFVQTALVHHPYRVRKPIRELKSHRRSVQVLCSIHPELKTSFGRSYYATAALHETRVILGAARLFRGRGISRSIVRVACLLSLVIVPPRLERRVE